MTEILKLEELQNDGLETSWGALWLGIRTVFGCNVDYPIPHFHPKSVYSDPKSIDFGSSWLKLAPRWPQVGPRSAPARPKAISLEPASVWRGCDPQRGKAGIRRAANREHTFVAEARRKCIIFD